MTTAWTRASPASAGTESTSLPKRSITAPIAASFTSNVAETGSPAVHAERTAFQFTRIERRNALVSERRLIHHHDTVHAINTIRSEVVMLLVEGD